MGGDPVHDRGRRRADHHRRPLEARRHHRRAARDRVRDRQRLASSSCAATRSTTTTSRSRRSFPVLGVGVSIALLTQIEGEVWVRAGILIGDRPRALAAQRARDAAPAARERLACRPCESGRHRQWLWSRSWRCSCCRRPRPRPSTSSRYVSCGAKGKHADAFCFEGDHPVAVFRALDKARLAVPGLHPQGGRSPALPATGARASPASSRGRASTSTAPASTSSPSSPTAAPSIATSSSFASARCSRSATRSARAPGPTCRGALPGWKVSQSVSISRFVDEGVSIVRSRGGLPGAIVFALGTNNDAHQVSSLPQLGRRGARDRRPAPAASSSPTSSARRSAAPATRASTRRSPTSPSITTTCGSSTGRGS